MERMTRSERLAEAERQLDALLAEWRAALEDAEGDGPAVLDITTEAVTTIGIAYGGPTTYLEYNHSTGAARFFTNAPDYAKRDDHHSEMLELYAEDAQAVEEIFQLDLLAYDNGFPTLDRED